MAAEPVDPFGFLIVDIRSSDRVMALVDNDPRTVTGYRAQKAPPYFLVTEASASLMPFGPGSGRLGMWGKIYYVKCAALKGKDADIRASAMARELALYLHLRGPRTYETGGLKVGIHQSRVDSIGPVLEDDVTGDVYRDVTVSLEATARAVP